MTSYPALYETRKKNTSIYRWKGACRYWDVRSYGSLEWDRTDEQVSGSVVRSLAAVGRSPI